MIIFGLKAPLEQSNTSFIYKVYIRLELHDYFLFCVTFVYKQHCSCLKEKNQTSTSYFIARKQNILMARLVV